MDVALVEHAEHDVDDEQRAEDGERLVALRLLEEPRAALHASLDRTMASRAGATARSMATCAWLRLMPGRISNEIEVDANWPQWLTRSGATVCWYWLKVESGMR